MGGVPAEHRPYSCGTLACPTSATVGEVFTCMAFEVPMRERPLCTARLLLGTASGERAGWSMHPPLPTLLPPAHLLLLLPHWLLKSLCKSAAWFRLAGALYTVNLEGRAVQSVAQAHAGALTALAVHAGFCATGSADGKLRLWGGDLREAYLEAGHEGAVTGEC